MRRPKFYILLQCSNSKSRHSSEPGSIGWKWVKSLRSQQKSGINSRSSEIKNSREEIRSDFTFYRDTTDGHGEWNRQRENGDSLL